MVKKKGKNRDGERGETLKNMEMGLPCSERVCGIGRQQR